MWVFQAGVMINNSLETATRNCRKSNVSRDWEEPGKIMRLMER